MPKKYERYAVIENKIYQLIKEKKFTLGFIKVFHLKYISISKMVPLMINSIQ